MKALIIEDDPATVDMVAMAFEFRWPEAKLISADKGATGIDLVEKESPDVVILDLGLPDMDGMDVLKEVRRFSDVPIIILTGRTEQMAILRGFELEADDYVTKPFDAMVLVARVKNVLGRTQMPHLGGGQHRIEGGRLTIDLGARVVTLDNKPVALTATDWMLLAELVRNEGRVVSQERLTEKLWGESTVESASTIRSYVTRLRAKLGDSTEAPKIILTAYGSGYRFLRPK